MKNNLLKKGLAISILFLFSVASIVFNLNVGAEIFDTVSVTNRNEYFNFLIRGDPPEEEWNVTFGGTDYDDGYSVQQTNDEGFIITGFTNSFGAGNWDALLIKTDSNGIEEWNHTFGGPDYDRGYSVRQTNDEGFIISGCTYSFGAGNFDAWLIKTDSVGIEEWNITFGGPSIDWGHSVQQTNDSGYIITGYTESYGAGESDVWLIKTNSEGIEEWNHTFGGINHDRGYSVQQTSDDGYVITGYTVSYDEDYTGCDVWLIKTDSNGNKQWHQTFGGTGITNKVDMGYSVQQTKDGGYIITGDTEIIFVAESDVLMIKTDPNGNEEWNHTFGGPYADRGRSVQQTKEGGYIIAGSISSFDTKDPDVCLIKTNSVGIEEWNYTFGFAENSSDWGYSVQQTNDNGYIISGATMPNGWKSSGSTNSNPAQTTNVWLIKVAGENLPPDAPKIDGPKRGKPGIEYNYTFVTTDLDGDDVKYLIDWGDNNTEWTEYCNSDEEITLEHIWIEKGEYTIKAKARDIYDAESDWTYFDVEIPRSKATACSLFYWFLGRFQILSRLVYLMEWR